VENPYRPPESSLRASVVVAASDAKMYRLSGIAIATFLGGLFAGGLLLSKNFKILGQDDLARTALIYSGLGMLGVIVIAVFIPESWNVPNVVFQVPQIVLMYQYAKRHQEADIAAHIENGGGVASNWKAAGIALLVVLGLVAIAVPIILLLS
jgi:hypothetical protein